MRRITAFVLLAFLASALPLTAMTEQERRDYAIKLAQILPDEPTWDAWLQSSGELPPDFDALPKHNELPDPLQFVDGKPVVTAADWPARRQEILNLEEKYQLGTIPPKPALDKVTVVSEIVSDGVTPPPAPAGGFGGFGGRGGPRLPLPKGTITRVVQLAYGPGGQATSQVTVTIPPGDGPFPVLIGSSTPKLIGRGYIGCQYPMSVDMPTNLPQLYPAYDFATMAQRAWTAQLVVDYLYTLPQVDKVRIAITGYSRLGKMALAAAALDERIAAVVAGSTGVGGVLSWRQGSERNQAESIETTTRMFPLWFTPRLRFFSGREDRLPIDGNLLVALVAPRACLIEYGMNDEVSNTWGAEQTLHSVEPLYALLGKLGNVGIMRVRGTHGANNEDMYLDWLDIVFGRSSDKWVNNLLFPWSLSQWVASSGEKVDLAKFPIHSSDDLLIGADGQPITSVAAWQTKADEIRKSINWLLGDAPSVIPPAGGPPDAGTTSAHAVGTTPPRASPAGNSTTTLGATVNPDIQHFFTAAGTEFGWTEPPRSAVATRVITFGEGVKGDLYYPANTPPGTKLPTVIWLHGYSYPLGYMWVYRRDLHPILALTQAGYAVLAYDQVGFGNRATEIGPFFMASPHWSQMGRLVHDARSALDALAKDDVVDPHRFYLFGYELGATTSLFTAALDPRVKGVVAVCGFTPMRTDTLDKGTGGIARWSVDRPLLPRVGFFIGHEDQIPVDFPEVIAAIAPRAVVLVAPQMDRDATPADVHAAVDQAKKVYTLYGATDKLALFEPWDYARLPGATQDWTINWLKWSAVPAAPPMASAASN